MFVSNVRRRRFSFRNFASTVLSMINSLTAKTTSARYIYIYCITTRVLRADSVPAEYIHEGNGRIVSNRFTDTADNSHDGRYFVTTFKYPGRPRTPGDKKTTGKWVWPSETGAPISFANLGRRGQRRAIRKSVTRVKKY